MTNTVSLILALICIQCVDYSGSYCTMRQATMDENGNPLPCTHDGITLGFGEKRVDYEKCEEYTCGNDGSFGICGIGRNAGVVAVPDGCTRIDGEKCTMKIVSENDHSQDCVADIFG